MDTATYSNIRVSLENLINRYNNTLRQENPENVSEETFRTWLNEFLGIFGWNVQDTSQVLQEQFLRGVYYQRLREIHSTHRKPDYTLLCGANIKTFLDAKSLEVNIFTNSDAAFQIRSYGWSAQCPCAFVSNFEQFVIYDTRFIPNNLQDANFGTIKLSVDEYLDNLDLLIDHLWRENICQNHLAEIYELTAIEGRNRVDSAFMAELSIFRKELAENIYANNPNIINNNDNLNFYIQIIIDRIVFIRVCESKGIEEQERLRTFSEAEEGFWSTFKNNCLTEFYNHYDGAMFYRDAIFEQLYIDDETLTHFIEKLYYPYPYCFDVIPVKVIANIYEEFLGKQLVINNGRITETVKEEYIKTNGAITTPECIVDTICKQTINLQNINTINELLDIKILDPCCGSGVFVVSCYEHLYNKALRILSDNEEERTLHDGFFYIQNDQLYLTIAARQAIISNCLYAIDLDASAVEVTKMSLALKTVDGNNALAWQGIGAFGDRILQNISENIKNGNTLVEPNNAFTVEELTELKPIDTSRMFSCVFENFEGFHYIVGNPPYVETKHFKAATPTMHSYLSEHYSSFSGKADLAVLFIEKCLHLLNENGVLGFIIQRRWFRTEYGKEIRRIINNNKHLSKLIDFKSTDIFKGRIVYASIMILSNQPRDEFSYLYLPLSTSQIITEFENSDEQGHFNSDTPILIPVPSNESTWNFNYYEITALANILRERLGSLSDYPNLMIKDGIQALWKKVYHLKNVRFDGNTATGVNGFNETVNVESDILRGIIYNRVFYPFKNVEPDAYCIFPYRGASNDAIPISEIEMQYPLAFDYLSSNEERIKATVNCREGEYWHTFTREHNQTMYNVPKIIVPMTARDTIATFVPSTGLYMDNANVWFMTVEGADESTMKAITCVINSTVFSVLGKSGANPQSGGYYKFNKQFLSPIPFPSQGITEDAESVSELAHLYDDIFTLQSRYLSANPMQKETIANNLDFKWNALDNICYRLYGLSEEEIDKVASIGRTVSRIELLGDSN